MYIISNLSFFFSPTRPLCTPSGLTAKNVLSRLVPGTPYTGILSHCTTPFLDSKVADDAAMIEAAVSARSVGAVDAVERAAVDCEEKVWD